jgi:ABC-type uncharacterized transport system permease subunit
MGTVIVIIVGVLTTTTVGLATILSTGSMFVLGAATAAVEGEGLTVFVGSPTVDLNADDEDGGDSRRFCARAPARSHRAVSATSVTTEAVFIESLMLAVILTVLNHTKKGLVYQE